MKDVENISMATTQIKKADVETYLSDLTDIGRKLRIYEEHLEEASFLYEQRMDHFLNQELSWLDIGAIEDRFEAHIGGLVTGGSLAFDICQHKVSEGDYGEFHTALRVLLRAQKREEIQIILKELDWNDDRKVLGLTEAFKHDLPDTWQDILEEMLSSNIINQIHSASKIIGFRRFSFGTPLFSILEKGEIEDLSPVIWALGKLKEDRATPLMLSYLNARSEEEKYAAAMAILRIGKTNITEPLLTLAEKEDWAFLPLGFCGDKTLIPQIHEIGASRKIDDHYSIALGLLGDLSSLNNLLNMLKIEDIAATSALALHMITGADLYEEIFIPDEIIKDELFDDEKEKLKRGEPLYSEGNEPGETIRRLSQKKDDWITWWRENASKFENGTCYRMGQPFSPSIPIQILLSEKHSNVLRKFALEELAIRYSIDIPLETDMLVWQQRKIVKKYYEL